MPLTIGRLQSLAYFLAASSAIAFAQEHRSAPPRRPANPDSLTDLSHEVLTRRNFDE
jgi:hypothetical protein